MNILIVGAGAVGKVYGRHLAMGGAQITFFVKEKYREETEKGFSFYELNSKQKVFPVGMTGFQVITSLSVIQNKNFDFVLLCVSSPALQGSWLDDLIAHLGNAMLVSFQPGILDQKFLVERLKQAGLAEDRLISGTIPIVSYEAPLPGEKRAQVGTAYWLPMGAKITLSGKRKVGELVRAFNRGKLRTVEVSDTQKENILAGPVLNLFVLALEKSEWSFARVNQGEALTLACAAMPEAVYVNAKNAGVNLPPQLWALHPALFRMILKASHWIVPFDFETYLKVHFTKVREQTHQGLQDYIAVAKQRGMVTKHLERFQNYLNQ